MKKWLLFSFPLVIITCGKSDSQKEILAVENESVPPYDTIAVDSFSQGATSVDVAMKIRMSSQKFQDSLRQVKIRNEEERLLNKEKEERLKQEKKAEELKNKAAAEAKKSSET